MRKKGASKSQKPKEQTPVLKKEDTTVKVAQHVMVNPESYRSAESYLISSGVNPLRVGFMAKWAENKGFTMATDEQWKEIFSEF